MHQRPIAAYQRVVDRRLRLAALCMRRGNAAVGPPHEASLTMAVLQAAAIRHTLLLYRNDPGPTRVRTDCLAVPLRTALLASGST